MCSVSKHILYNISSIVICCPQICFITTVADIFSPQIDFTNSLLRETNSKYRSILYSVFFIFSWFCFLFSVEVNCMREFRYRFQRNSHNFMYYAFIYFCMYVCITCMKYEKVLVVIRLLRACVEK